MVTRMSFLRQVSIAFIPFACLCFALSAAAAADNAGDFTLWYANPAKVGIWGR